MKKKYVSPEVDFLFVEGEPVLDIQSTLDSTIDNQNVETTEDEYDGEFFSRQL